MEKKRNNLTKSVALGGVFCAVAMVIMCLGGLIPIATYVCPMLCCIILQIVLEVCGKRIAWVWYMAVSFLSLMLGPDKEAAVVFVVLGYYPIIKPKLDTMPLSWLIKAVIFNVSVFLAYGVLLHVMGIEDGSVIREGWVLLLILILLGNLAFFLMDRLLTMFVRKWRKKIQ